MAFLMIVVSSEKQTVLQFGVCVYVGVGWGGGGGGHVNRVFPQCYGWHRKCDFTVLWLSVRPEKCFFYVWVELWFYS